MSEIIQDLSLEDVIGDRFGRYSKYIIQERALPDVRDGLKPVQRRILFAMYSSGNTYDKNFRKSAKTVGDVIGQYHPHGDYSVYDAMVRLSQDWKLRHVLLKCMVIMVVSITILQLLCVTQKLNLVNYQKNY